MLSLLQHRVSSLATVLPRSTLALSFPFPRLLISLNTHTSTRRALLTSAPPPARKPPGSEFEFEFGSGLDSFGLTRPEFVARRAAVGAVNDGGGGGAVRTKTSESVRKTAAFDTTKAKTKPKAKKTAAKKTAVKKTLPKKKPKKPKMPTSPRAPPAPLRPPTAFLLFFQKYLATQPKPTSLSDTAAHSKVAAQQWRALSEVEKQPFHDMYTSLRASYIPRRAAYFQDTDPAALRALNKQRVARGKLRLRAPRGAGRKPVNGFFRFMQDFRAGPEAQGIRDKGADAGETWVVRLHRAGGRAWRDLSDEERSAYKEAAKVAGQEAEARR